jgi:hypothetical protein
VYNPGQEDSDGDGVGDACRDSDGDGFPDAVDNCPNVANADKKDTDFDLRVDSCDPTPYHDLAVQFATKPSVTLRRDPVGTGVLDVSLRITNLANHPEPFTASAFIGGPLPPFPGGGLPPGCEATIVPPPLSGEVRRLASEKVTFRFSVTCSPSAAAGVYSLTINAFAFPGHGPDRDQANNQATTTGTLRVR